MRAVAREAGRAGRSSTMVGGRTLVDALVRRLPSPGSQPDLALAAGDAESVELRQRDESVLPLCDAGDGTIRGCGCGFHGPD